MTRATAKAAALGLALFGLGQAPAFASGPKSGGSYTIVDDATAIPVAHVATGGSCAIQCLAGTMGQVGASTQTNANGSVGAGFLDFQYNFERLHILLPGEAFSPGSAPGKTGVAQSHLYNQAFPVTVLATDNAFNVASTAAAVVTLSTTGANLPQAQTLLDGATSFSVVFTATGNFRSLLATAPGAASATSGSFGVFDPTGSSPTAQVNIPPGSTRATLNGALSGTASDPVSIVQVRVAFQRKNAGSDTGPYWDWSSPGFTAANPSFTFANLAAPGSPTTNWSVSFPDGPLASYTSYYVLAIASNSSGNYAIAQTTFVFNNAGLVSGSPGDGEGTATVTSTDSYGCKVIVSSLVFTAGPAGIALGGFMAVRVPDGWSRPIGLDGADPPLQSGFLHLTSTTSVNVEFNPPQKSSAVLGDNWIVVSPNGAPISGGQRIWLSYKTFPGGGPTAVQPQPFAIQTKGGAGGDVKPIALSPTLTLKAGPPAGLSFNPSDPMAVGPLQPSATMQLTMVDACGNSTSTAAGLITASLSLGNFAAVDEAAIFSQQGGGVILSKQVNFAVNSNFAAPSFYFQTSTAGVSYALVIATATLPGAGQVAAARYVRVLASSISLSNVSVDTGTLSPGALTATMTGNSFLTPSFVNFDLSDPSARWDVTISTSASFYPPVAQRFGIGSPGRSITWSGVDEFSYPNPFLSPGAYYVRVRVEGGVLEHRSARLYIGGSASIYGTVLSTGAGAYVYASGPGTNFGHFAVASSTGYFRIWGLQPGRAYNVNASTGAAVNGQFLRLNVSSNNVTASLAGVDVGSMPFPTVSFLRVSATIPVPAAREAWGHVFAHNADYTKTANGSLHYFPGASSSDDGAQVFGRDSSTWTVLGLVPGSYDVEATVFDVGVATIIRNVAVTAGAVTELPLVMQRKANVNGWVVLPSTTAYGAFASVQGFKYGERRPTVFGGAFVQGSAGGPSVTSNTYTLFGLDPGSWTITARAFGFASASTSVYVSSNADVGMLPDNGFNLTLSSGGVLLGTVTINGDTSQLKDEGGGGSGSGFSLFVNVFSPQNFSYNNLQLRFATNTVVTSSTFSFTGLDDGNYQLNVFRDGLSPVFRTVAVAGGAGNAGIVPIDVNNARVFVTVKLPGGPLPASEFRKVAFYTRGEGARPLLLQDMTAGATVSYFASSATWQSPSRGGGHFDVTALYGRTGAFAQGFALLNNGATAFITLDLTPSTFSVSGKVAIGGSISFSSAAFSVSVSSVAGLLANAGATSYCLMGSAGAVSTSTFHLELIPIPPFSHEGAYGGPLLASSSPASSCDGLNPPDSVGFSQNPFHAYVAGVDSDGGYRFDRVPAGSYVLRNNSEIDNDRGDGDELPQLRRVITVSTDTIVDLRIDNGFRVSGSLLAPAQANISRSFNVSLLDATGKPLQSNVATFNNGPNAAYSFEKVADGAYAVRVDDLGYPRSFGARPITVKVFGLDVARQDITLLNTGVIKGRLTIQQQLPGGTTRQFVSIGAQNRNLLPDNLRLSAIANPWFQGGYASARGDRCGPDGCSDVALDENDQFVIENVLPGAYDIQFESHLDPDLIRKGGTPLVNTFVPGVQVSEGRTTDVGTVNLIAGVQLRGQVFDVATSCGLPNVLVRARASIEQAIRAEDPNGVTDKDGNYVLIGLDPRVRFYDVYAADREEGGRGTVSPYEQKVARSVDITSTTSLNFNLVAAPYSIRGRVAVPAGGPPLRVPFGNGGEISPPGAVVFLQKANEFPTKNPVADIEFLTQPDGTFEIPSLTAGTYRMIVVSLDYSSLSRVVTLSSGSVDVGTLTLGRGGTLTGGLRKPDGSRPSQDELDFMVAATADLGELLFANLTRDVNTRTVSAYAISGFRAGVSYRLILGGQKNGGIVTPDEGRGIVFSTTTEARSLDVVLRPTKPFLFAKARRQTGGGYQVQFETSQPLRAKTAGDDDLGAILSTFTGTGALSQLELDGNRSRLTALYTPGVADSSFTLRLRARTTVTDPESLDPVDPEFLVLSTVAFFTGIDGLHRLNVSNVNGGTLIVEGDSGRITIPSGAFDVDASSSVEVTLQLANENLATKALTGLSGAAANLAALRFKAANYPPGLLAALAATPPSVNPLSGFYNVLLPLGVRTALTKPVQMCVTYSTGTDPAALNLYWYNEAANAYILQQDVTGAAPVIDTSQNTKCINVNHFSTFVLFNSNVAVITGNAFAGGEVEAFNFPNPFDLSVKTVATIHGAGNQTVRGTMIRFSAPADASGDGSIRIFNVAGERVRTIDLGSLSGGAHYYQGWDGRNDSGQDVASGVYIAQVKIGSRSKFFKMALIK